MQTRKQPSCVSHESKMVAVVNSNEVLNPLVLMRMLAKLKYSSQYLRMSLVILCTFTCVCMYGYIKLSVSKWGHVYHSQKLASHELKYLYAHSIIV